MLKKFSIVFLCLLIGVFLGTPSFSQDEPADDQDTVEMNEESSEISDDAESVEEESKTAETEAETGEETTPKTAAIKAKSYFDGVNTYVNSKVMFKLSSSDNFLTDRVIYKIDGGSEIIYDKEFNITAEGAHAIEYFGVDKIGNRENGKIFNVIVDDTSPELIVATKMPIAFVNEKYYVSKHNTFTVNAVDTSSQVNNIKYSSNGTDYISYATSFNFFVDGEVELKVQAEDNVTNVTNKFKIKLSDASGQTSVVDKESLKLFVDNAAPTVSIAADKEFVLHNGKNLASKDFKYKVSAADNESGVNMILIRIDGKGDFIQYEKEIEFYTNGEHFIEAKAIDLVGNVSNTVIQSVFVDFIPPKSTILTLSE